MTTRPYPAPLAPTRVDHPSLGAPALPSDFPCLALPALAEPTSPPTPTRLCPTHATYLAAPPPPTPVRPTGLPNASQGAPRPPVPFLAAPTDLATSALPGTTQALPTSRPPAHRPSPAPIRLPGPTPRRPSRAVTTRPDSTTPPSPPRRSPSRADSPSRPTPPPPASTRADFPRHTDCPARVHSALASPALSHSDCPSLRSPARPSTAHHPPPTTPRKD